VTIRLQVSLVAAAAPETVWEEMTDWAGQSRWIPLTTVDVVGETHTGVGVRAAALSGFKIGRIPIGLLDRFVVTGWTPPTAAAAAELEVLHLGPFFTGEGAFRLEPVGDRTRITASEIFALPGGRVTEAVARLALPLMRRAFLVSLGKLRRIVETHDPSGHRQ
jgi:Polyketide cyclase / dehydrase and lipid transport